MPVISDETFILVDLVSGNVITGFASEREAWDALRAWASDDGLDAIADLSLMRIEAEHPTLVAMEDELVRRVADELEISRSDLAERVGSIGRVAS